MCLAAFTAMVRNEYRGLSLDIALGMDLFLSYRLPFEDNGDIPWESIRNAFPSMSFSTLLEPKVAVQFH